MHDFKFKELKASGKLPSLPIVANELLNLIQLGDMPVAAVIDSIEMDLAFTERLLEKANLAFTDQGQPLMTIEDAIIKLGIKIVTRLALTLSIMEANLTDGCQAFNDAQFWSNAILCGLTLQTIAQQLSHVDPDEAFVIGLLSEIGSLALAQSYPAEYSLCIESMSSDLLQREREQFLIDHNQLTICLLKDWGLVDTATAALALAHRIEPIPHNEKSATQKLARLIKLGRYLAVNRLTNLDQTYITDLINDLAIDLIQFENLIHQINSNRHAWKAFFKLSILSAPTQVPLPENNGTDQSKTLFSVIDNHRRHERFFHQAAIKVISKHHVEPFFVDMLNLSKTGLFLSCATEYLPAVGAIVQLQTSEFQDAPWVEALVVRVVEDKGFAVEFSSSK